jgi:hypothetical protein
MTSTAAERPVTVRPPISERSPDGLLAGLALGLLPAELDLLAVTRWLPAGPPRPAGTPVASAVRPLNRMRRRAVAFPVAGGAPLAVAVFGAINYLPTFLQLAAGKTPVAGTGVDPVAYAAPLIPLLGGLVPVALLATGLLSAVRPLPLRAVGG